MSQKSTKVQQLKEITECTICEKVFTNPKILPCIHTFCLSCLEKCTKNKRPGEQHACPLCKKKFTIPTGGVKHLHQNFFMEKITEISDEREGKDWKCDKCVEEKSAKFHCSDCLEKMCSECGIAHYQQKPTADHHMMDVHEIPVGKLLRSAPSYCDQHRERRCELYCTKCRKEVCFICSNTAAHSSHRCVSAVKTSVTYRQQLKTDAKEVSKQIVRCQKNAKKIESEKQNFFTGCAMTQEAIIKKVEKLKLLIDAHGQHLLDNLENIQGKALQELDAMEEHNSKQMLILEKFKVYSNELRDKGSFTDILTVAQKMHMNATELSNVEIEGCCCPQIKFLPTNNVDFVDGQSNSVGSLMIVAKDKDTTAAKLRVSQVRNTGINMKDMH